MAKITHVTFGVHRLLRMSIAALCIVAAWPAAHAGDNIMREQDISEEAITNALTPQDAADRNETLGIMHRDVYAAQEAGSPTKDPSTHLLITFNSNSSKLTEGARAALGKVARGLQSVKLSPYKFRIEGHADPRGSSNANLKLSESRAAAVVEYLTLEGGVASDRLTPVGKGSTEPLNLHNPAAPENRRVTIVTVKD
ncbi:OmpA family protein [Cupriavidus sp. CV2]|uniref:OmpA family protein n=1 Tax=Cupriavidus ulmosensis TaxID=3065913 RepID=UPI00296AD02C|nr:OmpA family protein [Cupriavidus sp. CV2]MDW3687705.1 OmpA family protein [Cupriavidus sp. CV2]